MDKFIIKGGRELNGTVEISGSKNAALPILMATLLTDEPCVLRRVPDLRDVRTTFKILEHLGKKVEYKDGAAYITSNGGLKNDAVPYDLVSQMRASFWVAGPLLARFKSARISLPGGCAIGTRPVDIHLKGFEKLGAVCSVEEGDILVSASELKAAKIVLRFPSVGATHNLLMCASLIEGETVLENIAKEPEIQDMIDCLVKMGAEITADRCGGVRIKGKKKLRGLEHEVIADRIEAGTYMVAAAVAGGDVTVKNCVPQHNEILLEGLKEAGVSVGVNGQDVRIIRKSAPLKAVSITTLPYPGFATDMQAQWMALLTVAEGGARVTEDIFENRFMHAPELVRMGADIRVDKTTAVVAGVKKLGGARVMASDLRGGAALVIAGLRAKGVTEVRRVYHIDRGYERMEEKLSLLGADIKRVSEI